MVTTYETDYYNFNHRTSRNTDLEDYNCGGYALGTFNWYLPMSDLSETTWRLVEDRKMSVDEIAQYYADYILKDFEGYIRRIQDLKELKKDEQAIAFRVGEEDFHFCKRGKNGVWYHKPGRNTIRRIKRTEVFAERWVSPNSYTIYDSEIILFALKNQKNLLTNQKKYVIIIT